MSQDLPIMEDDLRDLIKLLQDENERLKSQLQEKAEIPEHSCNACGGPLTAEQKQSQIEGWL